MSSRKTIKKIKYLLHCNVILCNLIHTVFYKKVWFQLRLLQSFTWGHMSIKFLPYIPDLAKISNIHM